MDKNEWHVLTPEEVASLLKSDLHDGLLKREAVRRLAKGRNIIPSKEGPHPLAMLMAQFTDTMILLLLCATLISGLLGDVIDLVVILAIVLLNGVLGFVQEYRAEKSLGQIKKLVSPMAEVKRGGRLWRIAAEELVPGDLVLLEAGDRVPADIRIVRAAALEIEESCLTGESLPVPKIPHALTEKKLPLAERSNMAYMGTIVTRGSGAGIVVATGLDTVIGGIARSMAAIPKEPTPLQRRLDSLGKTLIFICLGACLAVTFLGLIRGENLMRMIMSGISLAVAAVPEGLPAIVTVVLSLGVQRMAKRNAIVRKLSAVETLGCTTVICSDKTGTLTENQMTVRLVATAEKIITVTGEGYDPAGGFWLGGKRIEPAKDPVVWLLTKIAYNCNKAELTKDNGKFTVHGDPTEAALTVLGIKAGLSQRGEILREIPFESERKMMSVVIKEKEGIRVYTKGALEAVMAKSSYVATSKGKAPLREWQRFFRDLEGEWAGDAYRVLAVAYKEIGYDELLRGKDESLEDGLCLVGLVGMLDPPRPKAAQAVRQCQRAGIVPIMITGDHPSTALAIARQIGISDGRECIGPQEVERMTLEELGEKALKIKVFARVSPQDKLKIVKALRLKGQVVAMTGDGVNDAPAIKEADIGISMGLAGTEVTKEASCMVLADDDFSTIVQAVHEGRAIYDNIRKFLRYLLGCNIGEVLTMFLAALLGMPLPLLPIQILWVNLITDGLPAIALGLEPPEPGVMRRSPRDPKEGIFAHGLGFSIAFRGIFISLSTLLVMTVGMVWAGLQGEEALPLARTMAFTTLVFAQLFYAFECRSESHSPFELGFLSNPYLVGAVLCSVLMQLAVLYCEPLNSIFHTIPLSPWQWALILVVSGGAFIIKWSRFLLRTIAATQARYDKLEKVELFFR